MSNILVAYFSPTGTTARVAETVAAACGGELYEITPLTPYTEADLDYNNPNSRSSIENQHRDYRPDLENKNVRMSQYDTVFIGYPIWWGEAPRIINTFLESFDFDHVTLIPFCTAGSSGIGDSDEILRFEYPQYNWRPGRLISYGTSSRSMDNWMRSLELNKDRSRKGSKYIEN
jgi:flavodoxin